MDEKGQDKIIAFDTLFTNNHIQMLKILVSYMDPSTQKSIAVYIKFMELQYTLSFFRMYPNAALTQLPREESFDTTKLFDEILPFCAPEEQARMNNMKNMVQNFTNMQEMMQMMQTMKDLFPEGENPFQGNAADILSNFPGMDGMNTSGIDFSQIMNFFQNNNSQEEKVE